MQTTIFTENKQKQAQNEQKQAKNKQKPIKITLNSIENVEKLFLRYLAIKRSCGVVDKTLKTYLSHFSACSRYFNTQKSIDKLTENDMQNMVLSLRAQGLSPNTIRSYTVTLRVFFTWCRQEGYTPPPLAKYKGEDIIKETYTDDELKILLKKPNLRTAHFPEYRTWVIINLLVNSGCRASTIRNIQIRDLDLPNNIIHARHTKNKKALVIPLCSEMVAIIREYLSIRGGEAEDYLFCNQYGEELSENALKNSIEHYNKRRGLQKTSTHLFRHTFARKYLIDCGGDAFTLQKLLGHSTLDMTRHYCEIFNADIAKNYDRVSPLAQLNAKNKKLKMTKK